MPSSLIQPLLIVPPSLIQVIVVAKTGGTVSRGSDRIPCTIVSNSAQVVGVALLLQAGSMALKSVGTMKVKPRDASLNETFVVPRKFVSTLVSLSVYHVAWR